jgi:hypothetical protein
MTRTRKLLLSGATVLVLAVGGVGIAQAVGGDSEEEVTGPQADRAKQAAVEAVGGGRAVGVERGDDGEAAWEVEIERDGREIEVNLDSGLERVGVLSEDDADEDENDGREGAAED